MGLNLPQHAVDIGTATLFFVSLALSLFMNIGDWRRKRG
jgi:hypothetical protein